MLYAANNRLYALNVFYNVFNLFLMHLNNTKRQQIIISVNLY